MGSLVVVLLLRAFAWSKKVVYRRASQPPPTPPFGVVWCGVVWFGLVWFGFAAIGLQPTGWIVYCYAQLVYLLGRD